MSIVENLPHPLGLVCIRVVVKVLILPQGVLSAIVVLFCLTGAFAHRNNMTCSFRLPAISCSAFGAMQRSRLNSAVYVAEFVGNDFLKHTEKKKPPAPFTNWYGDCWLLILVLDNPLLD